MRCLLINTNAGYGGGEGRGCWGEGLFENTSRILKTAQKLVVGVGGGSTEMHRGFQKTLKPLVVGRRNIYNDTSRIPETVQNNIV
jgi:hypothetical protein